MYCEKCGELLEDGSHFCSYCGADMTKKTGKTTLECERCRGTGRAMDEIGFMIRCPACKGLNSKEEV